MSSLYIPFGSGVMESSMSLKAMGHKIAYGIVGICIVMMLGACSQTAERTGRAMELIGNLDYQAALEELDKAQELEENPRLIYRARGIAYMGLVDYGRAVACFEEAIAGSNGLLQDVDFDLNYYLAAAYTKNGQYAEAEETYDAILALRPQEDEAYFLRGNVRMVLGNYNGAKEDFDRVVSMAPENYDWLVEIYEVLAYFGYPEDGKAYLRVALNNNEKKMSKAVSGKIYFYLEEYQNACLELEDAKENGDAQCYLYLGKAYEATGDYNYAANVYNSYLTKYEGDAQMYNQLGLCEMTRGEYDKALMAFQAGMQLMNSSMQQTLAFNEIVAYEHLGEFNMAYTLMETYLKNYPDDEQAKREYDFLSTRYKD